MMNRPTRRALALASAALALSVAGAVPHIGRAEATATGADTYVVVFKPGTPGAASAAAIQASQQRGATLRYRYRAALDGFAATLPDAALQGLRRNPNVELVEADQPVGIDTTESPATWGIDRIDQSNLPLSGSYTYDSTGRGQTVYVLDTGIRTSHREFGGRASLGIDAFGGDGQDCNGHGTHVAGIIGGATYGVAKGVNLKAVRVLDCAGSGTMAGVLAGVDFVAGQSKPSVANMSLSGGASSALDLAVNKAVAAGVVMVVAAGNSGQDACRYSPARATSALTVGATTSTDARATYSNYGACLDLFAPGSAITSAWYLTDDATNTISGTSMATPHVAGAAARYLEGNPKAGAAAVGDALVGAATARKVANAGRRSPNLLLFAPPSS